MSDCPLCTGFVHLSNDLAFARPDMYPAAHGHYLAMPKRHVARFVDLLSSEQDALFDMVRQVIDIDPNWDFTIGINDGAAAGQTVPHLHVHIIPRMKGDVEDPRGGVRRLLSTELPWLGNEDEPV